MSIEVRERVLCAVEKRFAIREHEIRRSQKQELQRVKTLTQSYRHEVEKLKQAASTLVARSRSASIPQGERMRDLTTMKRQIRAGQQLLAGKASELQSVRQKIAELFQRQQTLNLQQKKVGEVRQIRMNEREQRCEEIVQEEVSILSLLKERFEGEGVLSASASAVPSPDPQRTPAFDSYDGQSRFPMFGDCEQHSSNGRQGANQDCIELLAEGIDQDGNQERGHQSAEEKQTPRIFLEYNPSPGETTAIALTISERGAVSVALEQTQQNSEWVNTQQERSLVRALRSEGINVASVNVKSVLINSETHK